jgi:hypothetical protein
MAKAVKAGGPIADDFRADFEKVAATEKERFESAILRGDPSTAWGVFSGTVRAAGAETFACAPASRKADHPESVALRKELFAIRRQMAVGSLPVCCWAAVSWAWNSMVCGPALSFVLTRWRLVSIRSRIEKQIRREARQRLFDRRQEQEQELGLAYDERDMAQAWNIARQVSGKCIGPRCKPNLL